MASRLTPSHRRLIFLTLALLAAIGSAGCTNAVESGTNTSLDGMDLQQITDDMAQKIAGSPQVREEIAKRGKLRIVVEPVTNEMTAEVLPRGQAEAFTGRIRNLLSKHAPGDYTWIMNRDDYYKLRARTLEGDETLGPAPGAINPDFALVSRFRTITREDSKHRSSYYLCVFELTDLQHRVVLWSDKYEMKKIADKKFLD